MPNRNRDQARSRYRVEWQKGESAPWIAEMVIRDSVMRTAQNANSGDAQTRAAQNNLCIRFRQEADCIHRVSFGDLKFTRLGPASGPWLSTSSLRSRR